MPKKQTNPETNPETEPEVEDVAEVFTESAGEALPEEGGSMSIVIRESEAPEAPVVFEQTIELPALPEPETTPEPEHHPPAIGLDPNLVLKPQSADEALRRAKAEALLNEARARAGL